MTVLIPSTLASFIPTKENPTSDQILAIRNNKYILRYNKETETISKKKMIPYETPKCPLSLFAPQPYEEKVPLEIPI